MSDELIEPCPFCGHESVVDATDFEWADSQSNHVRCKNCGIRTRVGTARSPVSKKKAVNAWNRRLGPVVTGKMEDGYLSGNTKLRTPDHVRRTFNEAIENWGKTDEITERYAYKYLEPLTIESGGVSDGRPVMKAAHSDVLTRMRETAKDLACPFCDNVVVPNMVWFSVGTKCERCKAEIVGIEI